MRVSRPDDDDDGPLVAPSVAEMSSRYLTELTQTVRGHDLPIGDGSLTLETIVRQVARELIKDWLDQNLPQITERLVQREIERLSKQAGRR
jgi:cell pole-organizing protein PopZ